MSKHPKTRETPALTYWRTLNEEIDALDGQPVTLDIAYSYWEKREAPHRAAHEIVSRQELAAMLNGDVSSVLGYGAAYRDNRDACDFCADPASGATSSRRRAMEG